LDLRQGGQRQLIQGLHELAELLGVGEVLFPGVTGRAPHPVEVRSGAKRLAVCAQDDHPGPRLAFDALEGACELLDEALIEGIADLRAIEGDSGDRALVRNDQSLCRHGFPLLFWDEFNLAYMRKTPKRLGPMGAFSAAEMPSASTIRV